MACSPPALERRLWLVEQTGDYATRRFHHIRDATLGRVASVNVVEIGVWLRWPWIMRLRWKSGWARRRSVAV
jgi:hypothetical protein